MTYCRKCGAELSQGAEFCRKCGTSVSRYGREEWRGPRDECFGWERGGYRTVAIGLFILGIGVLFYLDSIGLVDWWPTGILFLIGIMIIVGGIIGSRRGRS